MQLYNDRKCQANCGCCLSFSSFKLFKLLITLFKLLIKLFNLLIELFKLSLNTLLNSITHGVGGLKDPGLIQRAIRYS